MAKKSSGPDKLVEHAYRNQPAAVCFAIPGAGRFHPRTRRPIRKTDAGFGYAGASLSVVIWSTLMRFLAGANPSVRNLAAQSLYSEKSIKFELGCLERWSFITLEADPADDRPIAVRPHRLSGRLRRDGWGSGRGIRPDWIVCPTPKGRRAIEIWAPLFDEIESRWLARFGSDLIKTLRLSLEDVATRLDVDLPHGIHGLREMDVTYKARSTHDVTPLPLSALLSQLLLAFTMEFQRQLHVPLWLCASTLRVLSDRPIPESEIPHLTGSSPETSGIGWQIKPFIIVESAQRPRRGKLVSLSPLGLSAHKNYYNLTAAIEKRWETQFGKQEDPSSPRSTVRAVRSARRRAASDCRGFDPA